MKLYFKRNCVTALKSGEGEEESSHATLQSETRPSVNPATAAVAATSTTSGAGIEIADHAEGGRPVRGDGGIKTSEWGQRQPDSLDHHPETPAAPTHSVRRATRR